MKELEAAWEQQKEKIDELSVLHTTVERLSVERDSLKS
jgi:hypothetical protein